MFGSDSTAFFALCHVLFGMIYVTYFSVLMQSYSRAFRHGVKYFSVLMQSYFRASRHCFNRHSVRYFLILFQCLLGTVLGNFWH